MWVNGTHPMLQFSHHVRALSGDAPQAKSSPTGTTSDAAQLIIASDGRVYVLKVASELRPRRRIAAEMLGMRLARRMGLPAVGAEPILLTHEAQRRVPQLRGLKITGEVHLALEYAGGIAGAVIDLPPALLTQRPRDVASRTMMGRLAAWLDARPVPRPLYWRGRESVVDSDDEIGNNRYRMGLADFSGCLCGGSWRLRPIDPECVPHAAAEESEVGLGWQQRQASFKAEHIAAAIREIPADWLSELPLPLLRALPHELEWRARHLRMAVAEPAHAHRLR